MEVTNKEGDLDDALYQEMFDLKNNRDWWKGWCQNLKKKLEFLEENELAIYVKGKKEFLNR